MQNNSKLKLRRRFLHVCGFYCSSKYQASNCYITYGQHAYIQTKNDASSKNEVSESTITKSKWESKNPEASLYLYNSNIICSSVDITSNECYFYSALECCPVVIAGVVKCFIIYSSIVNNIAIDVCGRF